MPEKINIKQRQSWMDVLKGIGIILVIIGHCYLPAALRKVIYSFHMPLFFFIGGLTLKLSKEISSKEFIKKKIKALLIPYVCMNLCTLASWIYFCKIVGHSEASWRHVLFGIVYANNDKYVLLCGPSWFIPSLFLAELGVFWLYKLLDEKKETLLVASFGMALLGFGLSISNKCVRPWHFNSVPMGIFFVTIGYYFASKYKEDQYKTIKERVNLLWVIVPGIIGLTAQHFNGKVSFGGNTYRSIDLTMIAAICLIFATVFFSMLIDKCALLEIAGRDSIIWLALHKTILFAVRQYDPLAATSYKASFLGLVIIVISMYPLSYVINHWMPFWIGKTGRTRTLNYINIATGTVWTVLTLILCCSYF